MVNLALAATSVLIGVCALEVALRVFPQLYPAMLPQEQYIFCKTPAERSGYHALFGKTEIPNSIYYMRTSVLDGWRRYTISANGFRDAPHTGAKNILVFGDSFAFGRLVGDRWTFSALLDTWLDGIAFYNFGVNGYGTGQAYLVYQEYAGRYGHRLAILTYYLGNDLHDNADPSSARPQFTLRGRQITEVTAPDPGARRQGPYRGRFDQPVLASIYGMHKNLQQISQAYNLLYVGLDTLAAPLLNRLRLVDAAVAPEAELLTEALLHGFSETAARHDAELLIVVVPSWLGLTRTGFAEAEQRQRDLIARVAKQTPNLRVLDLTPAIVAAGIDDVYGVVDKHFNEQGHVVAAQTIRDWLVRNGFVAEPSHPDTPMPQVRKVEPDCDPVAGAPSGLTQSHGARG